MEMSTSIARDAGASPRSGSGGRAMAMSAMVSTEPSHQQRRDRTSYLALLRAHEFAVTVFDPHFDTEVAGDRDHR